MWTRRRADTEVVRFVVVFAAIGVLGAAWVFTHRQEGDAHKDPSGVVTCLQASHLTASATTSSTGTPQVEIEHGSAQISANTTLVDSHTDIAFFDSEEQAAWWENGLRQAPGVASDSVTHAGDAVVVWGATATAAERSTIAACLS